MSEETVPTPAEPATQPSAPVSAPEGRYSVADDGQIFFQENITNPLPGIPVGRLAKGDAMLAPKAEAVGRADVQERLDIYIRTTLEPLFKLKQVEGEGALVGAAAEIGNRLYEHLGVMQRAELEDQIALLDADGRKLLRGKGVRLGPVLVFLPALVKPAAIKMRAMLWGIWNDKALPIARPADGRVSETVDAAAVDHAYYRMIGYPVFGPRCIRIDMLDRVVTDIYDTAKQGVFEAQHKYAEWFGCNLDDLHAVLEAMGHRKMKMESEASPAMPAADAPATSVPPAPDVVAAEEKAADTIAEVTEVITQLTPKAPPVIAKFMLRRGKMSDGGQAPRRRPEHKPKGERRENAQEQKSERPEKKFTPKKPYDPNRPQQKREREEGDERPRKPKFDRNKDRDRDREAKVYTFEGKKSGDDDDGNPFAILKNLKK